MNKKDELRRALSALKVKEFLDLKRKHANEEFRAGCMECGRYIEENIRIVQDFLKD